MGEPSDKRCVPVSVYVNGRRVQSMGDPDNLVRLHASRIERYRGLDCLGHGPLTEEVLFGWLKSRRDAGIVRWWDPNAEKGGDHG